MKAVITCIYAVMLTLANGNSAVADPFERQGVSEREPHYLKGDTTLKIASEPGRDSAIAKTAWETSSMLPRFMSVNPIFLII